MASPGIRPTRTSRARRTRSPPRRCSSHWRSSTTRVTGANASRSSWRTATAASSRTSSRPGPQTARSSRSTATWSCVTTAARTCLYTTPWRAPSASAIPGTAPFRRHLAEQALRDVGAPDQAVATGVAGADPSLYLPGGLKRALVSFRIRGRGLHTPARRRRWHWYPHDPATLRMANKLYHAEAWIQPGASWPDGVLLAEGRALPPTSRRFESRGAGQLERSTAPDKRRPLSMESGGSRVAARYWAGDVAGERGGPCLPAFLFEIAPLNGTSPTPKIAPVH